MIKRFLTVLFVVLIAVNCFAASQQTSSTLASTVITNVRSYLDESTAGYWDDDEILQWINDGTLDIIFRSKCLEEVENIDLIANTIEYSVTSNYVTVSRVLYVDSSSTTKALNHTASVIRAISFRGSEKNG